MLIAQLQAQRSSAEEHDSEELSMAQRELHRAQADLDQARHELSLLQTQLTASQQTAQQDKVQFPQGACELSGSHPYYKCSSTQVINTKTHNVACSPCIQLSQYATTCAAGGLPTEFYFPYRNWYLLTGQLQIAWLTAVHDLACLTFYHMPGLSDKLSKDCTECASSHAYNTRSVAWPWVLPSCLGMPCTYTHPHNF